MEKKNNVHKKVAFYVFNESNFSFDKTNVYVNQYFFAPLLPSTENGHRESHLFLYDVFYTRTCQLET